MIINVQVQLSKKRHICKTVSGSHHVVPEGASHLCVGLLAEMEAVRSEVGAVRATILQRRYSERQNVKNY